MKLFGFFFGIALQVAKNRGTSGREKHLKEIKMMKLLSPNNATRAPEDSQLAELELPKSQPAHELLKHLLSPFSSKPPPIPSAVQPSLATPKREGTKAVPFFKHKKEKREREKKKNGRRAAWLTSLNLFIFTPLSAPLAQSSTPGTHPAPSPPATLPQPP